MAHNGELCEQMVKEDVLTPLSVMLKEVSVPLPLVSWLNGVVLFAVCGRAPEAMVWTGRANEAGQGGDRCL